MVSCYVKYGYHGSIVIIDVANYDAVAKENSQLAQQLEVQQREIEALVADKARLVNDKKRMQETLVGGK